jgi:hypothetical protein
MLVNRNAKRTSQRISCVGIFESQYGGHRVARSSLRVPYPTDPVFERVDARRWSDNMCRNIKTLFNFEPPATEEEIRASSLQFVRKLSGFNSPSKANHEAFDRAVEEVATAARVLIDSLVTTADPRDREVEAARAQAKAAVRFGTSG